MYIDRITLEYPVSEAEIRRRNPNISFGRVFVPPPRFALVRPSSVPLIDPTSQEIKEGEPREENGNFFQTWNVINLPEAEVQRRIAERMGLIQNGFLSKVQEHLDNTARTRGYDGILSACSYAVSTVNRFRDEGLACVAWRDEVWLYCYDQLDRVRRGERSIPNSPEEFIQELPEILW